MGGKSDWARTMGISLDWRLAKLVRGHAKRRPRHRIFTLYPECHQNWSMKQELVLLMMTPPYRNALKREQEGITNGLAAHSVILDADLEGSGVGSTQSHLRRNNSQWPSTCNDWRGSVEPNGTVQLYLNACKQDFGLDSIVAASSFGCQLITEYGSYQLDARAIQEYMMRRKSHLWLTASKVTFGNPELSQRLIDIRTVGPFLFTPL